ncbi:sugar transporter [Kwoniella mangroviensis CBS 10435]|uniref:Sugar transporter n=1 Tax=Kwoniella mangroviensis CBS 10435 TaxID=1331196 RepID=A0A1B9IIK0_9TREE|nr:sugar transporter [Kwoniella mangroviensis CBS 8507]OCF55297.1 sugar transporter [Kwoniella mangroviensis CBS 10435]OCF65949.1 sugar transporter [Kwoniella mangroviensis CBS 8507]OCF71976.1 sugar transporter [Kwoniella mangroviensis CBS 8886]
MSSDQSAVEAGAPNQKWTSDRPADSGFNTSQTDEAPVPSKGRRFGSMESDNATLVAEVDTHYAAQLKPSRVSGKWLTYMVTFVAGTGFTLFGYDQGVLSSLLTLPSFEAQFPQTANAFADSHRAALQSFMVAIYELGCMAGALSNLWVGDRLGRRHTISLGGIIMIIGAILQTAAVDYAMMLVARVITGVGNGLLTSTVPAYQSECAKPHRRGQLVLIEGSLITFGIMMSYWIDLGFYFTTGSISWRFPIAFQILLALIMIVFMYAFKLPESPRWLAAKGKYAESLAVLAALENTSVDDKKVIATFNGICDAIAAESQGGFGFKELLYNGPTQNLRRTLLGVVAQCFQQICGINLITYYLTSVLTDLGLGPEMSRIISGVNGTCYFLTSIGALFVIERIGRRPLMFWMAVAQAITMAVLAGLYDIAKQQNKAAQVISVLCLFLFNTWFSIGWLGITWLYPAEVTPLRIRAPANALSTASNWIFNFMVVMATAPMFANIGWGTYCLFAVVNGIIICPCVWFFFPETKKYSLEEIDVVFALGHRENKSPVWFSLRPEEIPPAGSREAEHILGKSGPAHPDMSEKAERGHRGMSRIIKEEKGKPTSQHNEFAAKKV